MAKTKGKKILKRVLIALAVIAAAMVAALFIYSADYYRADATALAVLEDNPNIVVEGNLTIIPSAVPSDTALIFYPGGKVEHTAYLPILQKLADGGITSVLVQMPFNLAVFDSNAADSVFAKLPDIKNWYIGGHSLGGAMASNYASSHQDKVDGLILLGAYIYGDYPPADTLTVYGTFNSDLEKDIHYTENIVKIEGGNHAQFGNYGAQKGDPPATISAEQQQNEAVAAILEFIRGRE